MESIKRRNILIFAVLNTVTLGIYGIIECNSIGNDINMICSGDGEDAKSYVIVWLLGIVTFGIYPLYWWYKQANRLKYNAGRYHLCVRESGLSLIAFMSLSNMISMIIKLLRLLASMTAIAGVGLLGMYGLHNDISLFSILSLFRGGGVIMGIINFISALTPSMGIFSYIGLYFLFKNLNRFAEASGRYEAEPFHPMGYAYYGNNQAKVETPAVGQAIRRPMSDANEGITMAGSVQGDGTIRLQGCIRGISGSVSGYMLKLNDQDEVIIGKDPAVSNIIIDKMYKDVSRKHCSVKYIASRNEYFITDYSSNGTYVDDRRIAPNVAQNAREGQRIRLCNSDNVFVLGE